MLNLLRHINSCPRPLIQLLFRNIWYTIYVTFYTFYCTCVLCLTSFFIPAFFKVSFFPLSSTAQIQQWGKSCCWSVALIKQCHKVHLWWDFREMLRVRVWFFLNVSKWIWMLSVMLCNSTQHLSCRETCWVAHLLDIMWTVSFYTTISQTLRDLDSKNVCCGEKSAAPWSQMLLMLSTSVCLKYIYMILCILSIYQVVEQLLLSVCFRILGCNILDS